MSDYVPVPVAAAREVAQRFAKHIVCILSWDAGHGLVHTTTYGVTPQQKQWAAQLGDICAKAAGCELSQATNFEDFRAVSQAEWASQKEKLRAALQRMLDVHEAALDASMIRVSQAQLRQCECGACVEARAAMAASEGSVSP